MRSRWSLRPGFAHAHGLTPVARLSVTSFASLSPLPPSISLRSLRSLRLNFFCGQDVREPAVLAGNPAKEIFGGFRRKAIGEPGCVSARNKRINPDCFFVFFVFFVVKFLWRAKTPANQRGGGAVLR